MKKHDQELSDETGRNKTSELITFIKQGVLGTTVSATVYPFISIKNKIQTDQPINLLDVRGHFRGIAPFAASYVPSAWVAMTLNGMLLSENPSDVRRFSVGAISGAVSGMFCVVQENVAQNMSAKDGHTPTVSEVLRRAKATGGVKSLMRGTTATLMREAVFADSYLVAMPYMSAKMGKYFPNWPLLTDAICASVVGIAVGTATTPFDLWRAQKQNALMTRAKALSYKEIISANSVKKVGWRGAFRGAQGRSMACSIAIFCMRQGMKYIEEDSRDAEESNSGAMKKS